MTVDGVLVENGLDDDEETIILVEEECLYMLYY
jgi:hypothetical protein